MISIENLIQIIAEDLKIDIPIIEIVDQLGTATTLAAADPDNWKIALKKGVESYDLYFSVAHEMRHLWQHKKPEEFYSGYKSANQYETIDDYNLQPAELDAQAYGKIVMRDIFGISPQFNGLSDSVKDAIEERAQEIVLESSRTVVAEDEQADYLANNISSRDMRDVYEFLIENPEIFTELPMQFIVVKSFPDFVEKEVPGKSIIYISESLTSTGLCLLRDSEDIKSLLNAIFNETIDDKTKVDVFSVEKISDLFGVDIEPRVTAKRLLKLYQHTIAVAEDLGINVPPILVSRVSDRAHRITIFDESDVPQFDVIEVGLAGLPRMIHSVAHELRHCWQEYVAEGYYEDYHELSEYDNELDYMEQKEELDADAYASMYLNSHGYDGIRMAFDDDEEADKLFWDEYRTELAKRIREIKEEGSTKILC